MQTLINIAFGAVLASATLGPAAWADVGQANGHLVQIVSRLVGVEGAASPLDHAVAKARSAFPELPTGAH